MGGKLRLSKAERWRLVALHLASYLKDSIVDQVLREYGLTRSDLSGSDT